MKRVLPLFVMIDACGWEIIKDRSFGLEFAPLRKRLDSVFGYSSACIPSILSGRWPEEHRNWCYFVYDPSRSPFRALRVLRWLPEAVTGRRIFRRWLSRWTRRWLKFEGYFDLYNIPFRHIHLFDFAEKRSPLRPGGLNRGPNLFDRLEEQGVRAWVSDPERTEEDNLAGLTRRIAREGEVIDFAFLYWPGLDGLMHAVGNDAPEVGERLKRYEQWIAELMRVAESHYDEVRLYVFSDHGMANCEELLDLRRVIEAVPGLRMGRDYVVVYDSTMARFWFLNEQARPKIELALAAVKQGRILDDAELKRLRCLFPDRYFGELFFLVREGVLIVPSHMGERPLRAMHGFHPEERHSFAAILTNQAGHLEELRAIPDLHDVMLREALRAQIANHAPATLAVTEQTSVNIGSR